MARTQGRTAWSYRAFSALPCDARISTLIETTNKQCWKKMDKKALERELEGRMTQINRWIERDLPHPAPGTGSSTKERTARRCPTSSHCISFDSYIKPQLFYILWCLRRVVYLLIPTSNHNDLSGAWWITLVVYLLIPTSNHNRLFIIVISLTLYIFWFLHQTTTGI